jgi:chromosome segregation ATPase
MPHPQSSGEWNAAAATGAAPDTTPDTQQLRRELQDAPRELVDWEASCLKNIADLLDSLDKARVRWESLGNDLKEAQTRLARVQEERDLLAESATDAEKARDEARTAKEELEEIRRERDAAASELQATRDRLETQLKSTEDIRVLREENEALEQRLLERKAEIEEWRTRHTQLQTSEAEFRRMMELRDQELEQAKAQLQKAAAERDEARAKQAAAESELADAGTREQLQQDLARANAKLSKVAKDHEANLVEVCDLRAKLTKLEGKVEEAQAHERRRVRKILDKIHAALDDAGAPNGENMSFSERIRRLNSDD